ncbi:ABC transporter permease [Streptomyces gamaensis]|uniref:ABC transporter permease n=1 Tax=Streptomyces gamaensis TaxID=1763542 RepID=A0ABW0Z507_9ACTN
MIGKLAARSLRYRTGGFVATFLALFIGAVLVMACGGLMETGIRGEVPPQRLAGAGLVVTGDRTHQLSTGKKHKKTTVLAERVELPEELTRRVRAVPGVRAAVGERAFDAAVLAGEGARPVQAHGWESARLTPYQLADGRAPSAAGDIVLDAGLARRAGVRTGDSVRVAAHGGSAAYRVTGVAAPAAGRQVPQPVLFFSDAEAARLSGRPGSVAGIAVITEPGADPAAVRAGVAHALEGQPVTVLTGDGRGAAEHPEVLQGTQDLIALSGAVGGLVVCVAVFAVAGTVGLAARQRARELALLRAIGTGTGQLRRMLLGETLLVMLLAGAAAWPVGPLAGRWLYDVLVDSGMLAQAVRFRQGWIPALPAYGALLLTAVGGSLIGTRRAVRARPVEALGEAAVERREPTPPRIVLGLLFLAGATALCLVTALVLRGPVAASTAGPTVMCAAVGLALLGPWFTRAVTALLHWPVRLLTGPAGRLAVLNCRARTARTAAVATPVMLATAIAVGNLYLQSTIAAAGERVFAEDLRADAVITSASGGVDPALADRLRALPGVAAASPYVTSRAFTVRPHDGGESKKGLPLQGIGADGADRVLAPYVTAGSLDALRGSAVALPEHLARRMGLGPGDTLGLRLGDGTAARLRVVALFRGREGYETALTSAELLAPHTTAGLPGRILVRAADGTPADGLVRQLAEFARQHPGLRVEGRDAVTAEHARTSRTQASVNYLVIGMLVAYTALTVVNSTVVAVGNRRREFAVQRLTGSTKGQVLRMMAVEGTLVAAVGLLLGTLAAACALVPLSLAATGRPLPSGPPVIGLTAAGAALALTLAATLVPTWRALRARPVVAARA